MSKNKQTYHVRFEHVLWEGEIEEDGSSWSICKVRDCRSKKYMVIKGQLPSIAKTPGMEFRIAGASEPEYSNIESYNRNGPTVSFSAFLRIEPASKTAIRQFLMQASGVGSLRSDELYSKYGESTIEMLFSETDRVVSECPSVPENVIRSAASFLKGQYAEAEKKFPIIDLIDGTAIPSTVVNEIAKMRLADPVSALTKNPFMLTRIRGVGFKRADTLRNKVGIPTDGECRVIAAFEAAMDNVNDQVWISRQELIASATELLELSAERFSSIIEHLVSEGSIVMLEDDGIVWYSSRKNAYEEERVAIEIKSLLNSPTHLRWPMIDDPAFNKLRPSQREILLHNLNAGNRLCVISGPPGTGKTTVLASLLLALQNQGYNVRACAPTGKAAQRLTQLLKNIGVRIEAQTIHKMLLPMPTAGGGFNFTIKPGCLPADVVAIDETSMCNNWLANELLKAAAPGTLFVFVGDRNQLPPVGPGTMMRDVQQLGFREFTEIIRNDGGIVSACAAIRNGQDIECQIVYQPDVKGIIGGNLQWVGNKPDSMKEASICNIVDQLKLGGVSIHDFQFVTATHDNAKVGRKALNKYLQDAFNPDGGVGHPVFRVGDKVINLKNRMYGDVMVANGEQGIVVEIRKKQMVVELTTSKENVLVPAPDKGGDWDLGYAITVHRSQGSEWAYVIVCMGSEFRDEMVVCREWLYTAISRGKMCTVLLAGDDQVTKAIKRCRILDRKSMMLRYWRGYGIEVQNIPSRLAIGDRHAGATAVDF